MDTSLTTNLDLDTLIKILDYSSDEIFVLDDNQKIIYVNKACEKHYGLKKDDVINKTSKDLFEAGYWSPSIFPKVYEKKKPITIKQTTVLGAELITTAIPILDDNGEVEIVVTTAREIQSYEILNEKQQTEFTENKDEFKSNFITNCETVKSTLKLAERVAVTNANVLITGESGTGKGVFSQHIHEISNRKDKPFLTVNCAAIPTELMESELFGYLPGAFTGASKTGKTGLVEAAHEGTLFLDEIGELSLAVQAKLLQMIQDKRFIPIGSREEKQVDVRIIAATNRDLAEMVKQKQFREDLFYRLNVIELKMPPLRERKEDIIPLTYNFLYKFNHLYGMNKLISEECLEMLTHYSWPGNVRQLENLIERLVITSDEIIEVKELPKVILDEIEDSSNHFSPESLDDAIDQVKAKVVRQSFEKYGSSRKVANDLKISQTQANNLIRRYCRDLRQ